jgi:hypothetical protein
VINWDDYRFVSERLGRSFPELLYPSAAVQYSYMQMTGPVTTGDLNGDGFLDMGIVNSDYSHGSSLSILLGNGNGTFQGHLGFGTEYPINYVTFEHIDNDATLDLVFSSDDMGLQFYLGNGDGSFHQVAGVNLGLITEPSFGDRAFVVFGDLNGDGAQDAVIAGEHWGWGIDLDYDIIIAALGNGDSTFQEAQVVNYNGGVPHLSDLNNDNILDLLINNSHGISLLLGNGDGSFQSQLTLENRGTGRLNDINGDGAPDLLISQDGGTFVRFNHGGGTFQAAQPLSSVGLADIGDLNVDGHLDLLLSNGNVLLGQGDGSFQTPIIGGVGLEGLLLGDFNDDSYPDLATFTGSSGTSVLLGTGDGHFRGVKRFAVGEGPAALALGDLNADQALDIVVANSQGDDVSILLGEDNGDFQAAQSFVVGDKPRSVVLGDLNSDGVLDLAVLNELSADISVLLGNGDGSFQPQQRFAVGHLPRELLLSDLNADGVLDLLAVNEYYEYHNPKDADISVLLGQGNGSFQAQQRYVLGAPPLLVALGDLNNDSAVDLVTSNGRIILGNGDGSFQTSQCPAVDDPPVQGDGNRNASPPASVTLGDMNGDGNLDLVAPGNVLLGKGDGVFSDVPWWFFSSFTGYHLLVDDLNGDGVLDQFYYTGSFFQDANMILVALGNGDGSFQDSQRFMANASAWTSGDVNGDDQPDLVGVNEEGVLILFNRSHNHK